MVGSQVDSTPALCPTANKIRFGTFGMNTLRNLAGSAVSARSSINRYSNPQRSPLFFVRSREKRRERSPDQVFQYTFPIHLQFIVCCSFLLQSHDSWQGHDGDQVSIRGLPHVHAVFAFPLCMLLLFLSFLSLHHANSLL